MTVPTIPMPYTGRLTTNHDHTRWTVSNAIGPISIIQFNVDAVFHVSRCINPVDLERLEGRIVTISITYEDKIHVTPIQPNTNFQAL